jgi:hypothetical protein
MFAKSEQPRVSGLVKIRKIDVLINPARIGLLFS